MLFLLAVPFLSRAQGVPAEGKGSMIGIKSNIPYWATATFNLGAEVYLARHWTLELEAGLNPFSGKNDDGSYGRSLSPGMGRGSRYQLWILVAAVSPLELGGHGGRGLSVLEVGQVSLCELRSQARRDQEALLRAYAGGDQSDLPILNRWRTEK